MLLFSIRKLIASLLYPPTFLLLVAILGSLLLAFNRTGRKGAALLVFSLTLLFLLSIPAFQRPFLRFAESTPVEVVGVAPEAIVVLGAGVRQFEDASSSQSLTSTSIARSVEGIQLARRFSDSLLIFTGGRIGDNRPSSQAMAALAIDLGIDPTRIISFEEPTSTEEEAARTFAEIGPGTIYLVTSALHLQRAVELFRKEGLNPIPVPSDFLADEAPLDFLDFLPSAKTWENWQKLFHEIYGRIWLRVAG